MRPVRRVALIGAGALLAACALALWMLLPERSVTDVEREAAQHADPANGQLAAPALRGGARGEIWARQQDLPGPLELDGLVVDEANAPVAGATVTVASQPPRTATTGPDGAWTIKELLPRPYRIEAQKDDAFGHTGNVVPHATPRPIVIRLALGATVRVRVVEAGTHAPIPGAHVQLRDAERSAVITDETGWAQFRGMPPVSALVVTAAKPGFSTTHAMIGAGLAGQDPHAFHVELKRAGQLAGRVVDQSGRGIANATVVAADPVAGTPTDPANDGARSDERGEFVLRDVALGDVQLKAFHPDFRAGAATLVTVTSDAPGARVVLTLRRAVSVIGRVVDDQGQPAAWAEVHAYAAKQPMWNEAGGRHLVADGAGVFRIDGLPPTGVRLVASTAGAASSKAREIDLTANHDVDGVTLVVDLQGAISGTVVDGHHNPVSGVAVVCQPLEGKRVVVHCPGFETSDAEGHFSLRGLPTGSYKLSATRAHGAHPAAELTAHVGDGSVELAIGDVVSVKGKIQLADGGAPLHARVELQPGGVGVSCSADGSFAISELDPGAYLLLASGNFITKRVDGVHVAQNLNLGVITVERGRDLEGVVVDGAGNPVPDARVVAGTGLTDADVKESLGVNLNAQSIFTDAAGRFQLSSLPVDASIVIADDPNVGRSLPTPLVAGGGDAPLRLVLLAPGSVDGTVAGLEHGGGCFVALKPKDTAGMGYGASCDEHGKYRIARITEGDYHVELQGPGRLNGVSRDITVAAGQAMRVDF